MGKGTIETGLEGSQYCIMGVRVSQCSLLHTAPYLDSGYLVRYVDHMDCDIDVLVNIHSSPAALTTTVIYSN